MEEMCFLIPKKVFCIITTCKNIAR